MSDDQKQAGRAARAAARKAGMTVKIVKLGTPKPPPYAGSSPAEQILRACR